MISLGKAKSEIRQPNPNGINKSKLNSASAWTIGFQTPKISNIALPEIPGIKKNEKAKIPAKNIYKIFISLELISNILIKNPSITPTKRKISNYGYWRASLKKLSTSIDKKIIEDPKNNEKYSL